MKSRPQASLPLANTKLGKLLSGSTTVQLQAVKLSDALPHFQRGDWPACNAVIDAWLQQHPGDIDGLNMKASVAASSNQLEQAEPLWLAILQRQPQHIAALSNLGWLYQFRGDYPLALDYLQRALAIAPQHINSQINLATVYQKQHQYQESLAISERALQQAPQNAAVHFNIGCALQGLGRMEDAYAAYARTLHCDPGHQRARTNLLFCQHYLPHFDAMDNKQQASMLGQQLAAQVQAIARPTRGRPPEQPLRIGFVSADLHHHPVAFFLQDLLRQLPRQSLQLYAYSNNLHRDAVTDALQPQFAVWRNVCSLSDGAMAAQIVADEIDILFDLSGHTAGERLAVFAMRPAPVQISWLGYFSTTGLPGMDYILADPICVPPAEEACFSEQVLRLPHCRFCLSTPPVQADGSPPPAVARGYLTFGCYQALAKINHRVLACWATILQSAPQAQLRVQNEQLAVAAVRDNFKARLQQAGLPLAQIDLVWGMNRQQYLHSYREVDALLDTFPYPGGTTSTEALWMGVPTLTLVQPGMLGHMGETIAHHAGLPDWICRDEGEYIAKALKLSQLDGPLWQQLHAFRPQAPVLLASSPLFDSARFAADFTALLLQLAQRHGLQAVS